ncbi:hypothetical protein LCGC14_0985830 [marine sediment metagenome]|uniref:Uncharacterized protein n=1 Tax=marine sediment metagenome TaxID=412755 RepID=A0A0F9RDX8_9ZZZZ
MRVERCYDNEMYEGSKERKYYFAIIPTIEVTWTERSYLRPKITFRGFCITWLLWSVYILENKHADT